MTMTNLDFLAGLPAVLGVGGYVAFQITRLRENASPILKAIVDIIKSKGQSLPELDGRLTAKQVFALLQKSPELRKTLGEKDYSLLEFVMKRDERSHLLAIIGMAAALLMSLVAYGYIQTNKPKIVSASVSATNERSNVSSSTPNTIDDLVVNWTHSGENKGFTVKAMNANKPEAVITKQVMAADHVLRMDSKEIRTLWPNPKLGEKTPLRIEFSDENGTTGFGPFDVVTALEILYFAEGSKITVASMNGQSTLISLAYEARCVAWPKKAKNRKAEPEALSVKTTNGKATAEFPRDFDIDVASLKCVYFGTYAPDLVRYTNLNTE